MVWSWACCVSGARCGSVSRKQKRECFCFCLFFAPKGFGFSAFCFLFVPEGFSKHPPDNLTCGRTIPVGFWWCPKRFSKHPLRPGGAGIDLSVTVHKHLLVFGKGTDQHCKLARHKMFQHSFRLLYTLNRALNLRPSGTRCLGDKCSGGQKARMRPLLTFRTGRSELCLANCR